MWYNRLNYVFSGGNFIMMDRRKAAPSNDASRSTKGRRKNRKPKKQHPILKKIGSVLFVLISIGIVCASVAGLYVYNFAEDYVNGEKKIDLEYYKANQEQTSIIYAYDSNKNLVELISLHGAENREWIDYKDIPTDLIDAFRDLEDKRFNEHNGVDFYGTVFGVVRSGFERGASTITQQLIKNITSENGRTVSRKFYEILNALNVERFYHKKTIMEFYLNTVYLGNGCYGVKTAAEKYFGKEVKDLTVAECAALASITKAPGTYDPLRNPDNTRTRQLYCLSCMLENGSISQKEYNEAKDYELIYTNSKKYKGSQVSGNKKSNKKYSKSDVKYTNLYDGGNSYYVEYVIDDVIEDLQKKYDLTYNEAWRKVFFGGLRIYSAVDLDIQKTAEKIYVKRQTFPKEKNTKKRPAAQSAITIMDYNGRVVAMVGGAGKKGTFRGLNRATQSPRQPGSSIKPLSIYAPAIDNKKITWSTMIQNYGIKVGSKRWPKNVGGNAGSPNHFVTTQYAVQVSYNTVPTQIARKMGLDVSLNFLSKDLKMKHLVTDPSNSKYDGNYSSMCVGGTTYGVTTLEMASAFAIFGNNGYYYEPYAYYKVTNHDGTEVLLKSSDKKGKQVIAESSSGVMRRLLQTVCTAGTGKNYKVSRFTTFGKTGTTSDNYDRWFVGGTPYYVAAVWYGYDEPRSINNTSGNPAGKLFKKVMDNIHDDLDKKSFPSSSGVVTRKYCKLSGNLATPSCGSTATGYYRSNNLPKRCQGCNITNAIGQGVSGVIVRDTTNKPSENKTTTKKNPSNTTTQTTQSTTQQTTQNTTTTQGTTIQQQVAAAIDNSFEN